MPGDVAARPQRVTPLPAATGRRLSVVLLTSYQYQPFPSSLSASFFDSDRPAAEVSAFREHFLYYGRTLGMPSPLCRDRSSFSFMNTRTGRPTCVCGPAEGCVRFARAEIIVAARLQIFEQSGRVCRDNFVSAGYSRRLLGFVRAGGEEKRYDEAADSGAPTVKNPIGFMPAHFRCQRFVIARTQIAQHDLYHTKHEADALKVWRMSRQ